FASLFSSSSSSPSSHSASSPSSPNVDLRFRTESALLMPSSFSLSAVAVPTTCSRSVASPTPLASRRSVYRDQRENGGAVSCAANYLFSRSIEPASSNLSNNHKGDEEYDKEFNGSNSNNDNSNNNSNSVCQKKQQTLF